MKVGEIWKPRSKFSKNASLGNVLIIRIEVGTIMGANWEKYNPNAEYVCFKYLDSDMESGSERGEFIKNYLKDYEN